SLGEEHLSELLLFGEVGAEQLDDHQLLEPAERSTGGGQVHVGHPATADLPDELVAAGEIRSEGLRDEVGHGQNSPSRVRTQSYACAQLLLDGSTITDGRGSTTCGAICVGRTSTCPPRPRRAIVHARCGRSFVPPFRLRCCSRASL